ncbi:MurT ligase domain-containing protein [Peptococcus simiae]|uniref:Lipid II isoglutaminyl synthase (glutamine-hydrolyzing) subunit MurT n=1 Tax=Peptococcus simiae TaxID=1643805 RepID=A0ABW9H0F6_9FIRM
MKVRSSLAKLSGQMTKQVLTMAGRDGSSLPGKVAQTIEPNLLADLAAGCRSVVVTGTNGKTMTTALLVKALEQKYPKVLTNASGANMLQGITSTFLTLKKNEQPIAVLEVDEATLPYVTEAVQPEVIVFTNIFRDQADRYGSTEGVLDHLRRGARLAPTATIIANGDLPAFAQLKVNNPVRYYGSTLAKDLPQPSTEKEDDTCPSCGAKLSYSERTYGNLGHYHCEACAFSRPQLDFTLEDVTSVTTHRAVGVVNGTTVELNTGGFYNLYNALAAFAAASHLGVKAQDIVAGLRQVVPLSGRQEVAHIEGKEGTLHLIKNPVGFNQIVQLLALEKDPFSLAILLNDLPADGVDTSWVNEADFESLLQLTDHRPILLGGRRTDVLQDRLSRAGAKAADLKLCDSDEALCRALAQLPTEKVHILPTFTALADLRRELVAKGYIQ